MRCAFELFDECGASRIWAQCRRCGRRLCVPVSSGDNIVAACNAFPTRFEFGHWAALILAALGLTKHRYRWLKTRLGMQPTCGCQQREESLNSWGERLAKWWRGSP